MWASPDRGSRRQRFLRGLIYKLFVDGKEVADARNFFKIPTKRRLEARVELDGTPRTIVVDVKPRFLSAAYELRVDDAERTFSGAEPRCGFVSFGAEVGDAPNVEALEWIGREHQRLLVPL